MRMKREFIQPGMPFHHYQGLQALNVSSLKELQHSPAHYRFRQQNPKQSARLAFGSAAHCATLEPERYLTAYAIWDRKTDSGRASPRTGKAWGQFVAEAGEREVLTEDEHLAASAISRAVRNDPVAGKYLQTGQPEVTMVWRLEERACKGRVDWLTEIAGEPVLVGLKTARDCRPSQFGAMSARLGYHMQWYWYAWGFREITGQTPRVVEIVVDAEAPHHVVTYLIPEEVIGLGATECERLLDTLHKCECDNYWPGPAESELVLSLPAWAWRDEDEDDLGGGEALNWEGAE
jgi:hypothetical protein